VNPNLNPSAKEYVPSHSVSVPAEYSSEQPGSNLQADGGTPTLVYSTAVPVRATSIDDVMYQTHHRGYSPHHPVPSTATMNLAFSGSYDNIPIAPHPSYDHASYPAVLQHSYLSSSPATASIPTPAGYGPHTVYSTAYGVEDPNYLYVNEMILQQQWNNNYNAAAAAAVAAAAAGNYEAGGTVYYPPPPPSQAGYVPSTTSSTASDNKKRSPLKIGTGSEKSDSVEGLEEMNKVD
jgi:hypothetical protein